jgi:peptide-methionine (S)-S-oxide reductase
METALFAAGPFWEAEDAFRHLEGVIATTVGYAGGDAPPSSHQEVASGGTGHAEAVEVTFDPDRITYEALLEVFWGTHDPTVAHSEDDPRRSVVFHRDPAQEAAAVESLNRLATAGGPPPRTRILPAGPFFPADEQHQHYYEKRFG